MAYTNIDDSSAHFHTQLYTGNGTAIGSGGNVITNNANSGNFKPDWTWHKVRSTANDHQVYDSSRGVKIRLNPNANNSDFTLNEGLQSFDTNGFTVGSDGGVNTNNQTYVAWQWKANGGTTASNSDGSITSTVQANQDAGFSIVTYTTAGSAATIGHGLGAKPDVILLKKRNGAIGWLVRHVSTGTSYLSLNSTMAAASNPGPTWTTTEPTTSVYSIGTSTDVNVNGGEYIAYCFAEKQGYSKFGKYVGNGSADGPFVYTGFKPAFFLLKKTSGADGWRLFDNKRAGYNDDNYRLAPDASDAEDTATTYLDILSNGVKIRGTAGSFNQSGGTFIYMAFAENPFTTSTGIPTTAR